MPALRTPGLNASIYVKAGPRAGLKTKKGCSDNEVLSDKVANVVYIIRAISSSISLCLHSVVGFIIPCAKISPCSKSSPIFLKMKLYGWKLSTFKVLTPLLVPYSERPFCFSILDLISLFPGLKTGFIDLNQTPCANLELSNKLPIVIPHSRHKYLLDIGTVGLFMKHLTSNSFRMPFGECVKAFFGSTCRSRRL